MHSVIALLAGGWGGGGWFEHRHQPSAVLGGREQAERREHMLPVRGRWANKLLNGEVN